MIARAAAKARELATTVREWLISITGVIENRELKIDTSNFTGFCPYQNFPLFVVFEVLIFKSLGSLLLYSNSTP